MSLLEQKYKILGMQASTSAEAARTEGALNIARANAITNESPATIAATRAAAYKTTQEGGAVAPLARSEIGLRGAQGGYYGAETRNIDAQHNPGNLDYGTLVTHARKIWGLPDEAPPSTAVSPIAITGASQPSILPAVPVSTPSALPPPPQWAQDYQQDAAQDEGDGYSSGTSKVPGKGSGKVDTVPAMLAPGEAVLNKGAAEHMGRGMIAAVNKIGLARMGVAPDAKSGSAKPAKGKPGMRKGGMVSYAMGIEEVPAIAATPATQATQGGLQKRPQKLAKGTAVVKGGPSSKAPLSGDGDSIKERDKALAQDKNDKLHAPSMLHGMQLMAAAMGMLPARQGFHKGTSKVTKGKGGKSAPAPGGGGPLGLSPDMTAAPQGGAPSPDQINPLLMALSQGAAA